uniref:General stress protein n=1 Tax=Globodera pallida TaxID=36090 RepID=A0A183BIE2_GLOPA
MAREARWERNVYCADWMAHMLQKLAYVNLTTSVVLVSSVVYQPFKVAVKEKVVPLTIEVNNIKENLTDFVTTVDKNNTRTMNESDNAKIVDLRGKLGEKMDEIAKEESIGNSSSMDFFVNMNYGDVDRGQITTKPVILKISSVGKKTPMPEDDEKKGTNATKPSTKKANADNGKKGNNAAKPPTKKPK